MAGIGGEQSGDHAQQGRFAAAGGPEECEDFSALEREVDFRQYALAGEGLAQAAGIEGGLRQRIRGGVVRGV